MTKMFKIALPDGSVKEMPEGSTPADVAAAIGPGLAKAALAARIDGEVRDITRPFEGDASLALITSRDEKDALELVRRELCPARGRVESLRSFGLFVRHALSALAQRISTPVATIVMTFWGPLMVDGSTPSVDSLA